MARPLRWRVPLSMAELRSALRSLRKTPGFSLVAILTIAVGIGANTALFSVFDRLILNPANLPQPSALVAIWKRTEGFKGRPSSGRGLVDL